MKKVLSILFWLCLLQVGMGQSVPTFSKLFVDTFYLSGGCAIASIGNNIYFSRYSQTHDQAGTITKADGSGNSLADFVFSQPNFYYYGGASGSLRSSKNGSILWATQAGTRSPSDGAGFFCRFKGSDLDTISTKFFRGRDFSALYGVTELSDGNYLLSGADADSFQTGHDVAWLCKVDTGGHIIWQDTLSYDIINEASTPYAFPGGFYQYWHSYHYNTVNDNAKSAIFVDKYDNDGNLKWRDTFGIVGNENLAGPFTALNDGGGLLVVNVLDTLDPHDGLLNLPTVMYRFDSNGRILREKYFPQIPAYMILNSVIEDRKGELVFAGGGVANASPANPNGITGGLIMKLDSLCNLVFFKVIRYDSTISDRLFDITETADGGYAAVGNAFHAVGNLNVQAAWLVKVDSNGCLNGDCPALHTAIEEVAPESDRFLLFPNPAASQFTIAVTETEYYKGYKDLQFRLYDLTGRLVMNEALQNQANTFPVTDYTAGVYLWQISEGDRKVSTGKLAVVR